MGVRRAQKTFPTGDPNFSVLQAFPAGFSAEESDPMLMLDHFGPIRSGGEEANPDSFPVDWHPHRGQDLLTYMVSGVGRHADSMGNRESFASPGAQWIRAGSGIMHAEGGGTPAGQDQEGFQIWLNVPSEKKMQDPSYGTHPPSELPLLQLGAGSTARLLAGALGEARGPANFSVDVQIVDYTLAPGTSTEHAVAASHDNCLCYCYRGAAVIGGAEVARGSVTRLVPSAPEEGPPAFALSSSGASGAGVLVFCGRQLKQPIAWHGPFVMTSQQEIQAALSEYRSGTLLKKRAPWDFTKASAAPPK